LVALYTSLGQIEDDWLEEIRKARTIVPNAEVDALYYDMPCEDHLQSQEEAFDDAFFDALDNLNLYRLKVCDNHLEWGKRLLGDEYVERTWCADAMATCVEYWDQAELLWAWKHHEEDVLECTRIGLRWPPNAMMVLLYAERDHDAEIDGLLQDVDVEWEALKTVLQGSSLVASDDETHKVALFHIANNEPLLSKVRHTITFGSPTISALLSVCQEFANEKNQARVIANYVVYVVTFFLQNDLFVFCRMSSRISPRCRLRSKS
jgi:hypothetical protein